MDPGPPIRREEVEAYLFRVYDIAADVAAIRQLLGEDDGEEEEDA